MTITDESAGAELVRVMGADLWWSAAELSALTGYSPTRIRRALALMAVRGAVEYCPGFWRVPAKVAP